jgi:hypothetical protein
MRVDLRVLISLSALALLLGAVACSSSASSPTAPSAAERGATIEGTVQAGTSANSSELTAFSTAGGIKVTVMGTSLSTTTDSSGRFVLQGVAGGSATLRFQGQGVDATIELGGLVAGQTLTITVRVSGSQAVIVSPASPAPPGRKVEFSGRVESVTPPTLMVSGRKVMTNGSTRIRRGDKTVGLADLKVGEKVEVKGTLKGTRQTDNSVLASKIKVEDDEEEDDDDGDDN